jgi:CheY-specific phosphatase CheX
MSEELRQSLVGATLYVMETSAFMSVWPWSPEDGELPRPDIAASMTFAGPTVGRLTLRVSSEVLPTLTLNMLGEYEGVADREEKSYDALREVLNMICGNLLTSWHGEDPVFKLSTPLIEEPDESGFPDRPDAVSVRFCLEGTLAEILVCGAGATPCPDPADAHSHPGGIPA